MTKLFTGTYTAIITPFTDENKIDWTSFKTMVERQISGGVEGIVFMGTTGESPTLTHDECIEIYNWAVNTVKNRCKVILGTSANDTKKNIELSIAAKKAGAHGQLCVSPYYNKPSQNGLYLHFKAIAEATDLPVILYNIKGRTGVNLETETLLKLSKHKNIVAVKEASGDIIQMMDVIRKVPSDFSVLVGDDALLLPFIAAGGDGVISVVSNLLPRKFSDLVRTCLKNDFISAKKTFYELFDLMDVSFIESNPIPVKEMLSILGYCKPEFRLPMCRANESSMSKIKAAAEFVITLEK